MLRIRLARAGRHKTFFFRIVLTEHTKPVNSGFKSILGWHDPVKKQSEANVEKIKEYIKNGAKPSERVARILYNLSGDEFFQNFYTMKDIQRAPKKKE